MSSKVRGQATTHQTETMYFNSTTATDEIICGVNCQCPRKQKTATEKIVPGYEYVSQLSDGKSDFGELQLYRNKKTKSTVAVKKLTFVADGKTIYHELKNEVKSAMNISHPNIAKYYDFFVINNMKVCVVMEYTERGSLRGLLNEQIKKKMYFNQNAVLQIIHDVITGMQVLNSNQILHCDLKPENILVGDNGIMKICDFGTAHEVNDTTKRPPGTTSYMAPELFDGALPDEQTEIWALGVIFYEICTLQHPFKPYASEKELIQKIKAVFYKSFNCRLRGYSYGMQELLEFMLQKKPQDRLTLSKIESHSLFKTVRMQRTQLV